MKKQNWSIGQTVNVGFVSGLEVIGKVATPGDHKPDLYVLLQTKTRRLYRFVPHMGLSRCQTLEEAASW